MRVGFRIEGDIGDIEDAGPGPELLLELLAIISNGGTWAPVRDCDPGAGGINGACSYRDCGGTY